MNMMDEHTIAVPASVPPEMRETYIHNYRLATHDSGRLMLFAGDQKVEHLNNDFAGPGIAEEDGDPEHLFRIASGARIGAFATQLGLIARYGSDEAYSRIPYMAKLNSKTNLVPKHAQDPLSTAWYSIDDVVRVRDYAQLLMVGVGYTIYLGSQHENEMLREAAHLTMEAHRHGLLSTLWIYPRGAYVQDEHDPAVIIGAAGVAAALGADFVKLNPPHSSTESPLLSLQQTVRAAGRTKVICAGGSSVDPVVFLKNLYDQIHTAHTAGNATGRNIHQKPLLSAIAFCNALYAITVEDKSIDEASSLLV